MANQRRRFIDGNYFHIYQRGNHRDIIYRDAADRRRFLAKLEEYCDWDEQTIIAYCLMGNHYHLAIRQDGERALSQTLRSLLQGYAQYYNRKYGTVGALFQGRFGARLVDHPEYNPWDLARLTRYIHRNPFPFADFATYRWSSYAQYARGKAGLCETEPVLQMFPEKDSYARFCESASPSERAVSQPRIAAVLPRSWPPPGATG